jgi:hypothetical protein
MVQALPSSQGLPNPSNWHELSQQSPLEVLPSSHCSPGSTMPLPHAGVGVGVTVGVGVSVGVSVGV